MKEIILSNGKIAIVDNEDFKRLNKYKWSFVQGYAFRNTHRNRKNGTVRMHREILKAPMGTDVDHKNGNRLDNRKENIRVCTHS